MTTNNRQSTRRNSTRTMFLTTVVIVLLIAIVAIFAHQSKNIEKYSSTANYQFLMKLNNKDPEAIERYQYYIDKDEYLFDGPLTIRMMAEKYGLDSSELYNTYVESDYDSAQKFYDEYVKELVG